MQETERCIVVSVGNLHAIWYMASLSVSLDILKSKHSPERLQL